MDYSAMWRTALERAQDASKHRGRGERYALGLAIDEFMKMALPEVGPWNEAAMRLAHRPGVWISSGVDGE